MRTNLLSFLLMAGTVVGCASNPPPPPMAMAEPAPVVAPPPLAPFGPMAGKYSGTADQGTELPAGCAKMTRPVTATIGRGNAFTLAGIRGTVNADGAISSRGRGGSLSGTVTPGGMDVTATKGKCTYHYMLTRA